jgi:hypothetical protein
MWNVIHQVCVCVCVCMYALENVPLEGDAGHDGACKHKGPKKLNEVPDIPTGILRYFMTGGHEMQPTNGRQTLIQYVWQINSLARARARALSLSRTHTHTHTHTLAAISPPGSESTEDPEESEEEVREDVTAGSAGSVPAHVYAYAHVCMHVLGWVCDCMHSIAFLFFNWCPQGVQKALGLV